MTIEVKCIVFAGNSLTSKEMKLVIFYSGMQVTGEVTLIAMIGTSFTSIRTIQVTSKHF